MFIKHQVDIGLLRKIDELPFSQRFRQWTDAVILKAKDKPIICTDRIKLAMDSWKKTEGEDIEIRRAKLVKKVLENVPIDISNFDLVVGRETQYLLGTNPFIDLAGNYIPGLLKDEELGVGSFVVKGGITKQDREVLKECSNFFAEKVACDYAYKAWHSLVGTWWQDAEEARLVEPTLKAAVFPGKTDKSNYEKVLAIGLRGIIEEAKTNTKRFMETQETEINKFYFWKAVIIVCEALIKLARRYAEHARYLAQREQNDQRRKELEEIANVCDWVPENPPRTFHEAIQSMVFVRLGCALEHPQVNDSLGRVDQFLWPYFEKDIRDAQLTLEMAAELVGGLIEYAGTHVSMQPALYEESVQTVFGVGSTTLGGVTRGGQDATNELTYLFLHVEGLLRVPEPHIAFRWHPGTPHWLLLKAIETNAKVKGGNPHFENDTHVIENWVERGVSVEDARDWYSHGCVLPGLPNKIVSTGPNGLGAVNIALILDLTLHNGIASVTGKQIGIQTGDPRTFSTFADLLEAFKKQHEFIIRRILWLGSVAQKVQEQYVRLPLASSFLPGCIEKGKDTMLVDPGYTLDIMDRAIVDTADSLTVIKELVFDKKKLTMDELLDALDSNFQGEKGNKIRQWCLDAPKFGNDIDEADSMVREIGSFSASVICSYKGPHGIFNISREGLAWHYFAGKGVGALPNGRKSGEPLNDGGISPMRGMDKLGPTAVLRSVLKADFKESNMTVLNQKFSATLMRSPESREKLAVLTDTFFRKGGQHVQYNIVDAQELRDAKKHPELYKELLVRVGGFSAYFVTLSPEVQDEIIARTEHEL